MELSLYCIKFYRTYGAKPTFEYLNAPSATAMENYFLFNIPGCAVFNPHRIGPYDPVFREVPEFYETCFE